MPRVSIGLPVFNGEHFIEQSVCSVLDQTYGDFELVISDNASTDRTVKIIESVIAGDDRARLVRNTDNRGAAWNYNEVYRLSRGELFRWHAHDDYLEPGLIEQLVDALDAEPDAVLAHSWTRFVDHCGTTTELFADDLHVENDDPAIRLSEIVRRLTYCNAVFGLVRSDVLGRSALIAPFPASDVSLLYELAILGKFTVVPDHMFVRRPGNSLKTNRSTSQLAEWFAPSARGAVFPGFWLWWASVRAIWRSEYSVRQRLSVMVAFLRAWPISYARHRRRRFRRRHQT